jgi:CRISPR-associated protein (TIGR03986 family)
MSLPEQTKAIAENHAAMAPYNFVPLPQRVVLVESVPCQDRYHTERHTGRIDCTITTASPLYIRTGWQPEDFAKYGETSFNELNNEQQAKRAAFFHQGDPERPIIPGSSLRGMLRSLVEIVGYGKMEQVTDKQRFFFRAVAATKDTDDPLAQPYKTKLANVRAGYLTRRNDGWAIIPAQLWGREGYLKARQTDLPSSLGVPRFNDSNYQPIYVAVSFTTKTTKKGRMVIDRIDLPGVYDNSGTLVTSGSMIETGSGNRFSQRKNHAVVGKMQSNAHPIPIEDQAIEDYCSSLTAFQRGEGWADSPFDKRLGVLAEGRPIFYVDPGRGKPITMFGQSPNFRIPFRFPGTQRAASPRDFVPEDLRRPTDTDLAEAIFGYVRREKVPADQARAGRVFVSDAELEGEPNWASETPVHPQILSGPKPTTFQHYLVQGTTQKRELKHYASTPGNETVIRGHKRYWHKPNTTLADMIERDLDKVRKASSQYTQIKPLACGMRFHFEVRYENLSTIELGALLWVLRLAADERYRLALGMGKPLGMGAVAISSTVYRSDRHARYRSLFDDSGWNSAEEPLTEAECEACANAFEQHVLKHSQERVERLEDALRIRCLLALLSWQEAPQADQTRYMELERFKDRPVLPLPTQVNKKDKDASTATSNTSASTATQGSRDSSAQQQTLFDYGSRILADGEIFRGEIIKSTRKEVDIKHPGHPDTNKVIGKIAPDELKGEFKVGNSRWVKILRIEQIGRQKILWLKPTPNPNQKKKG